MMQAASSNKWLTPIVPQLSQMQMEQMIADAYLTAQRRVNAERSNAQVTDRWHEKGARSSQVPPVWDWVTWLILAGRGWGKTRTAVEWALMKARTMPGSRGAIVCATAADARDVMVEGESGFLNVAKGSDMPTYEPSKRRLTWANGSQATLYSAEKPRQLRGPQHHWFVADELAAWQYPETWDMLMFGMRLGEHPQGVVATTPRPTKIIRELMAATTTHLTRGNTFENADNLAPSFLSQIVAKYQGTRLGRQELEAEILDDVPGALWTRQLLDDYRIKQVPELRRIVVAVDPAVTNNEESAATGIVVTGLGEDRHGYVLQDASMKGSPAEWGRKVVQLYDHYKADRIIAETNNGGDMIKHVITTAAADMHQKRERLHAEVSFTQVHASRGKYTRAEPVSALYEQGRIHHVGVLAALEDEMCTWLPGETSPDRMDAMVWAFTELMLDGLGMDNTELATAFGWQG
jgi:phage terminase large subunit-like protein